MVTKSLINQIQNLKQKKFRQKTGLFVAEGEKLIQELLEANFKYSKLLTTENNTSFPADFILKNASHRSKIIYELISLVHQDHIYMILIKNLILL